LGIDKTPSLFEIRSFACGFKIGNVLFKKTKYNVCFQTNLGQRTGNHVCGYLYSSFKTPCKGMENYHSDSLEFVL